MGLRPSRVGPSDYLSSTTHTAFNSDLSQRFQQVKRGFYPEFYCSLICNLTPDVGLRKCIVLISPVTYLLQEFSNLWERSVQAASLGKNLKGDESQLPEAGPEHHGGGERGVLEERSSGEGATLAVFYCPACSGSIVF